MRPSLLLDFAKTKMLDKRITFTRNSKAGYFDRNGVYRMAAAGEPRFDFDPITGACKGLLIEEQRTNFLLDSENLAAGDRGASTGWYILARSSISANTTIAPDGTLTADKVVEDTSTGTHLATNRTSVGSTTNTNPLTVSAYLKAAERSIAVILLTEGTTFVRNALAYFDLSAGTATTPTTSGGASSASATITNVGNGWYRCTLTATLGGTDTQAEARFYPTTSTTTTSYTGDGTSGIYIWGAQLEAGSFPTSYIKTEATQTTRAADVASMTGSNFSSWYRQDEGTFVVSSLRSVDVPPGQFPTIFRVRNDVTGLDALTAYAFLTSGQNRYSVDMTTNGVSQFSLGSLSSLFSIPAGQNAVLSVGYKTNDCAASMNGSTVVTDTVATMMTGITSLNIGIGSAGASHINGHISRLAYYPKRLTNTELQALTA